MGEVHDIVLSLPRDVADAALDAVVAHAHRLARRLAERRGPPDPSTPPADAVALNRLRAASALLGDALGAPERRRFR